MISTSASRCSILYKLLNIIRCSFNYYLFLDKYFGAHYMRVFWFSLHDSMSDQWEKKKKNRRKCCIITLYNVLSSLDSSLIMYKYHGNLSGELVSLRQDINPKILGSLDVHQCKSLFYIRIPLFIM